MSRFRASPRDVIARRDPPLSACGIFANFVCPSSEILKLNPMDNDEQSATKKVWSKPVLKAWNKPEIRDQSIRSLTESKPNVWPSEASPGTGS